MLQATILLKRSGIMETVSIFAAVVFNLFLFLSSLNVANSKEDNNRSIASVRSISDLLPAIGVFLFIAVGIVFCGFCSKFKSKYSSSGEKNSSLPDENTLCLENIASVNGDVVGATDESEWGQDADIYDCVNETAGAQPSRTLNTCNQEESRDRDRDRDVTSDETEMVYNIVYQSVDSVQTVDYDDSDLYDKVGPNPEEGANKSDAIKSSLKSTKKTVGICLSQPPNTNLVSYSEDANTAAVKKEPLHRRQSAPYSIKSGTKKKPSKAMTLQIGANLRTPLDPLPEEDHQVTEWSSEVRNGRSDSTASQVVKEKSQTLMPNTRRHPGGDALVYELCKVQEMRKGGGTLPPLRNRSEKMTEVGNNQSSVDKRTSQEIDNEKMPVTCHSNNDDVTSQQSVSSCSDQSSSDTFDADSVASADGDFSSHGNEQSDIVDMDTPEPDEQCEDSHRRGSKHTYVNVDATTDFHSEISDDEDKEIYDNLGANREGVCEVTSETDLSVPSQEAGTSSGNGIGLPAVDTDQVDVTCRYEEAKVGIGRRSTLLKKAKLVKEDETDENDDIFYPNPEIEGNDEDKEGESNASRPVIEQEKLDTHTRTFSTHNNPSQQRPHKIFTNESFLKIQEAIAMQQALNNNNPAQRVPVFSSRYRIQRFSL